jgi:hypothetical protein
MWGKKKSLILINKKKIKNNNNHANPKLREGFRPKGFQIYNLNDDICGNDMIALEKKAEKYTTNPIFNQDINLDIETTEKTEEFNNDEKRKIRSNRSKNLNRGKLLKHARPLNNFFAKKGEYIYAHKRKRSNQNLKIEKIRKY